VLFAALVLFGVAACGFEQPVAETDKALFLRVADLARVGVRYPDSAAHEKFSKTKHLGGVYELSYQFQTPESEERRPLFIYASVSVQTKATDAMMTEGAEKIGLLIGLKREGVEERDVAGAQRYGDSSRFALLVRDDKPIGNLFTMREGRKTYLLVISGVYFEDPELWKKLIGPKLEQLAAYSPS
jgi:hypothetical protein